MNKWIFLSCIIRMFLGCLLLLIYTCFWSICQSVVFDTANICATSVTDSFLSFSHIYPYALHACDPHYERHLGTSTPNRSITYKPFWTYPSFTFNCTNEVLHYEDGVLSHFHLCHCWSVSIFTGNLDWQLGIYVLRAPGSSQPKATQTHSFGHKDSRTLITILWERTQFLVVINTWLTESGQDPAERFVLLSNTTAVMKKTGF